MMVLAGRLINWLVGKGLVVSLVVAVAALTGKLVKDKRDELVERGVQKCERRWEVVIERRRRKHAEALAEATAKQAEATDLLNTELKRDVARITEEIEVYRVAAANAVPAPGGPDPRICITDGVRALARGVEGEGGGVDSAQGSKPAERRRTKAAQPPR